MNPSTAAADSLNEKYQLPWWMITILLAILGGIAGFAYAKLFDAGYLARWQRIGTLPEKPAQILAFRPVSWERRTADIIIEMSSGRIYQYKSSERSWVELAGFESSSGDITLRECNFERDARRGAFSRLPGEISICGHFDWTWEWFRNSSYYAILEDHSVWYWYAESNLARSTSYLGWDSLTAVGVGWLIIWLVRLRPRQANKWTLAGYTLFSICMAGFLFWLFRITAPFTSGFTTTVLMIPLCCLLAVAILVAIFASRRNSL